MKKLHVLKNVLIHTKATEILASYFVFLLADAAVIWLIEPDITSYGDALWYCYAVLSTAGFGDIVAHTFIGKACSVLLTVYSTFVIALVTGVVVNFYQQVIQIRQEGTLSALADKLQRLPELSKEELQQISENAKKIMNQRKN